MSYFPYDAIGCMWSLLLNFWSSDYVLLCLVHFILSDPLESMSSLFLHRVNKHNTDTMFRSDYDMDKPTMGTRSYKH